MRNTWTTEHDQTLLRYIYYWCLPAVLHAHHAHLHEAHRQELAVRHVFIAVDVHLVEKIY